jgi:hypothetical protein
MQTDELRPGRCPGRSRFGGDDVTTLVDLPERIRDLADRARRLPPPSHSNPEAFHIARDELGADLEILAATVRELVGGGGCASRTCGCSTAGK